MRNARIRVFDVETGPDPDELSNGVVEIGWTDVIAAGCDLLGSPIGWFVGVTGSFLVNPINPIPYESMGIHHITDRMVAGQWKWSQIVDLIFAKNDASSIVAYAAHSIETEQKFITPEFTGEKPWICTFQSALHLYPEATSHSNQSLRYMLRPDFIDDARAFPVHRAGPDSFVTACTLAHMLNEGNSWERLVHLTETPALLHWCKHRRHRDENGKPVPWSSVDSGYLGWMLGPDKDFGRNEQFTARHHLEQREIDQRIERENADLARQFAANNMISPSARQDSPGREFAPIEAYSGGR